MTDFELTKNNGEVWEFRGISVDAVDQVREALRRDVPDLTDNEIKQIGSKFWNKFVTYGITQTPPQSITLKHPRTQETIYTIQRVVRNREQERRIPFGELVLKTRGEPPASNPGALVQTAPEQRAQNRRQLAANEEFVESKDDPTRPENDDPTLPGGKKKKKARKYTQRKKKNGSSKIRRHKTRRVF